MASNADIEQLSERLRAIHDRAIALEAKYEAELSEVHPASRDGARNLVHYLALRKTDTNSLRGDLRRLGLSPLVAVPVALVQIAKLFWPFMFFWALMLLGSVIEVRTR